MAAVAERSAGAEHSLLRFLTCGSVDDGKSTLIGRLLYEQDLILDDQWQAQERDSRKHGSDGDGPDFSLLVDGLEIEREQAITIDVAYRYFSTPARSFVVADTPGHEQYTRNMATGASNSELAVLLVDAKKGLQTQTFRHAAIASFMGIRHVVLAVNKMDLVGFDAAAYRRIVDAFTAFAGRLNFRTIAAVPLSARDGDNISRLSERMAWYQGPTLVGYLETIDVEEDLLGKPLRLPVQIVSRPNPDFRGFCGTIASGTVRVGDAVAVAGSGRLSHVAGIIGPRGEQRDASPGDAITLTLTDEIDIARGDLVVSPGDRPETGDRFCANLIWMAEEPLLPGGSFLMKIGTITLPATVGSIRHRYDISNHGQVPAQALALNEIGLCDLVAGARFAFDTFAQNHGTGSLILISRATNATVAAGMITTALSSDLHRQTFSITKSHRAGLNRQRPVIIWFTGLSGAGKSTLANLVETRLNALGAHTMNLDGDNLRHGLTRDLGFSEGDRLENIRRTGEVAKLMVEAGLIVLCSFISPFRLQRLMVRELVEPDEFIEVFVDTPLQTCIERDVKGLYRRALAGELKNFTGVDQAYERPESPELVIRQDAETAEQSVERVIAELRRRGVVASH